MSTVQYIKIFEVLIIIYVFAACIHSVLKSQTKISVSFVKSKPFYQKHSKHEIDDYQIVLPIKRMLRYKVRGVNPATKRRKTIYNIILPSWKKFPSRIEGIEPPYEFIIDMKMATDRQKNLLFRKGFIFPEDLSLEDASVIISHFVADTEEKPCRYVEPPLSDEFMEIAAEKEMLMPSFLSYDEARLFLTNGEWRKDL